MVAAVFDAFFTIYQRKIADLVKLGQEVPVPYLLAPCIRISSTAWQEASKVAQQILHMCIRAFDYLPPVDVTFGDYLRALVTAD